MGKAGLVRRLQQTGPLDILEHFFLLHTTFEAVRHVWGIEGSFYFSRALPLLEYAIKKRH